MEVPPDLTAEEAARIAVDAVNRFDTVKDPEAAAGVFQEAARATEVLRRLDPVNPWLYYLRGRVYAVAGRGNEAVEQLREFTRTRAGRNEWRGHRVLGDLFVEHYPRLARASYEAAYELNPKEPAVLFGLSRCAFAVGEITKAVEYAKESADTDGHNSVRYENHLAKMLAEIADWPAAQRAAVRALALAKASAQGDKAGRPILEVVDEQYQLLIEILQKRVNAVPGDAQAYLDLAGYLREQADNAVTVSRFDVLQVLAAGVSGTAPKTPVKLAVEHAIALARVGRREQAIERFERILVAEPENVTAKEWLERLRPSESE